MKKIIFLLLATFVLNYLSFSQKSEVFIKNNKAIDGYDVVAFFTNHQPIKGDEKFIVNYNNAIWYFSSQQNADSFKLKPEKYAPQFGGYCAYGCSNGYKAPTQIETWAIYDDKLYFNYNLKVKDSWMNKKEVLIPIANDNWIKIKDKS